ncbi:DUF221-domain-containing protein [Karstenula rhodostoma CBS 690.94]|uniref:DUF221-domain-containing protein n=1 Tax=Karstenula rhodostoma CBS 690.94 TaxID=1392251 RepID=A0A9P4UIN7_9PLEO|nr:DUF221-domain-containing protein [Karstenula rhodostoma CBS 690.94]
MSAAGPGLLAPRDTPSNSTGIAQESQNQSIKTFAASLSTAAVVFGVQIFAFLILSGNWKIRRSKETTEKAAARQSLFHKIYYYKTAFVSKRKRIAAPTTVIESFKNVFTISDREVIRVAGVDGYLFLQYLQLLLRIFIPMAIVILPILLPINRMGDVPGVSGLDSFAWPNVGVQSKRHRLWAHAVLAVCVVIWVCYNFYRAMRKFVRLRQTILTLPEHRIRASATTILVQSIPRKWLTMAALDALYDVFPGGIKEVWINRDYDELSEKVKKRVKIARGLENAEVNLIIECTKKHKKMEEKKAKQEGKKKSKKEKKAEEDTQNHAIHHETQEYGLSVNNPHQIEQTLQDVLKEDSSSSSSSSSSSRSSSPERKHKLLPIPILGEGIHAVGDGFRDVGRFGGKVVGGFAGGIKGAFGKQHSHNRDPSHPETVASESPVSPVTADFGGRGTSSDTYTPLNNPAKVNFDSDGTATEPNSPDSTPDKKRPHTAESTLGPLKAINTIKNSRLNPVRRLSAFASPQPFRAEGEEFPLEIKKPEDVHYDYAGVFDPSYVEDGEDALWRKYIKPKDRETMRVPLFNKSWWPSLPLIGKKVDTIYYCRKELARLNHEIGLDQSNLEQFPLMNSAFIQFNHQVAAHMACQSLSHHIPQQMNPRTVEVNPNDIIWDNLTMPWWSRYVRMTVIVATIVTLIILWSPLVAFTGGLSKISTLTDSVPWLAWIEKLPVWLISFIQGVLPPLILAILFAVLPIILRLMAEVTGTTTMGERELLVQNFYFAFVFVQLFLVVSISSGITGFLDQIRGDPSQAGNTIVSIPQTLAEQLPKAANYFFSYLILQAFSISSGTLLQIGAVALLLFSRFLDTTPRQKVSRVLSRPGITWGNMIPVYTNFGAIGLIYAVIAPLLMVVLLITFSLFWFTYRYQMIYVSYAKAETNGLIFPKAINQLFTGLYFLEITLIGLFILQRGPGGDLSCFPQAIIIIVTLAFTVLFQFLLNRAFGPLFNYLPITFEDEAVERDQEFQRAQETRWQSKGDGEGGNADEHTSLNSELSAREKAEHRESERLQDDDRRRSRAMHDGGIELKQFEPNGNNTLRISESPERMRRPNWADRSRDRSHSHSHSHHKGDNPHSHSHSSHDFANSSIPSTPKKQKKKPNNPLDFVTNALRAGVDDLGRPIRDIEAQTLPTANLFDNIDDQLEDIEPEARQKLIKRSFQHPATRAIQPAVWIPHDELGIAADEIGRTGRFSGKIWITSVNARLDASGHVLYRGLPPDRDPFENIEV